jgi:hypothetical protein
METVNANSESTGEESGMVVTEETVEECRFLLDPVSWGERMLVNRDGSPRAYRDYQVRDLRCPAARIVHLDGRSVGKTIDLSTLLLHFTFINKGKSVLVAAPYQGQLNLIAEEVEFQFNSNPLLRDNVVLKANGKPHIKRHPYFEVLFRNGCAIYFRPAGDHGDVFRSLHVDLLLVDEAAWLSTRAWNAVQQCLNAGGVMRVYSTPNGLRNTPYYRITQSREYQVFRWPSWLAPDWSEERDRELTEFYGGKDTPGYRHEVAGEHGAPSYGAFPVKQVVRAVAEISDYRRVDLTGEALEDCTDEREVRERIETLLGLTGGFGRCWMGVDLGYTSDPTELLLFEEDEDNVMSLVLRVHAERVAYPALSEVIALLDRVYDPVGIGLDRGGNGTAVEHELLSLDKFRDRHFSGRLVGYNFGGTIAVGEDEQGKVIKKRVKEEMTRVINKALHARKVRLPAEDPEVEDQLCTQTYVTGDRGIVYSKGNDHIVDAMRCAFMRHAQDTDDTYDPIEIVPVFCVAHITRKLP